MKQEKKYVRETAFKIHLKELILGTYIQEEESEPNYLLTADQRKIYRLNLMAVILRKDVQGSITNLLIDDGTDKIIVRSFEENKIINNLNVGDTVLVIGKLRMYNQEKYVSPEIIKKVDHLWLKLRNLELMRKHKSLIALNSVDSQSENNQNDEKDKHTEKILNNRDGKDKERNEIGKNISGNNNLNNGNNGLNNNPNNINNNLNVKEESIMDTEISGQEKSVAENFGDEDVILPVQKIINLIRELDQNDGVPIEEIIEKSPLNDTEQILETMLENGDIFQNLPGRVKVL